MIDKWLVLSWRRPAPTSICSTPGGGQWRNKRKGFETGVLPTSSSVGCRGPSYPPTQDHGVSYKLSEEEADSNILLCKSIGHLFETKDEESDIIRASNDLLLVQKYNGSIKFVLRKVHEINSGVICCNSHPKTFDKSCDSHKLIKPRRYPAMVWGLGCVSSSNC